MNSVAAAEHRSGTSVNANTFCDNWPDIASSRAERRFRSGRQIANTTTANATDSAIVRTTPVVTAVATPATKARSVHAVTSLMAAQVSAMLPRFVCCAWRSLRMRARTGNAVTDIETPIKSEKTVNPTCAVAYARSSHTDIAEPRRNGARMLACEIVIVASALRRTVPKSSSSPTRNMNSTTPTFAIMPMNGVAEGGECRLQPRTDGAQD